MIDEVEEILYTADIGVATSQLLIEGLRKKLSKKELKDPQAIWEHIRSQTAQIMTRGANAPLQLGGAPCVILMVGVNGTGKTTTAGSSLPGFRVKGTRWSWQLQTPSAPPPWSNWRCGASARAAL